MGQQRQQGGGLTGPSPLARQILVPLHQGGVGVDGGEDLAKPQSVAHGEHELGDPLAGVSAHYCGPQDLILAGHGEHFDKALTLAVGDGSVQLGQLEAGQFEGDALRPSLFLIEADPGDFGGGVDGGRHDPIVGPKALERAEQGIDRGIPA